MTILGMRNDQATEGHNALNGYRLGATQWECEGRLQRRGRRPRTACSHNATSLLSALTESFERSITRDMVVS